MLHTCVCVYLSLRVCGPVLTLVTLSKAVNPFYEPLQRLIPLLCVVFLSSQRRNGEDIPVALTKNINHRRFAASFHLKEVTNQDQDLYRCVTQSERGSGVSNFAGLIVRGEDIKSFFYCLLFFGDVK